MNGSDGNPLLYMTDLYIQKNGCPLAASGTPGVGGFATVNTTASTANCISTAAGTAAPSQLIGTWTTATVVSNIGTANVNIGFVD